MSSHHNHHHHSRNSGSSGGSSGSASSNRISTSIPIFPLIFSEEEGSSSSLSSNIINTFLHTLIQSFMRSNRNSPTTLPNLDNQEEDEEDDGDIGLEVNFIPGFSFGNNNRGDFFTEDMDLGDDEDKDEEEGGISYNEQHQLLDPEEEDDSSEEEEEEEEEDSSEENEEDEGLYEYDEDYEDYDGVDHEDGNYMHNDNIDEDNDHEHENDNENETDGVDDDETGSESNPFDLYDYDSSYTTSTLTHYGTIGYILYRTISRSKLYSVVDGKPFLGQLIGYFLALVKDETPMDTTDAIGDKADSLEKLMSIIPSIEYLKQMIYKTKYTLKEAIVINCLLDMHTFYALNNSSPPYTPLLSTLLPLLRDFHTSKLTPPALRMLASQYKKVLGGVKNYDGEFKILDNRDDYKKYYSNQEKEMRNLVMGCAQTSFIR
eukprot:TRINITY_DN5730_c0_g1_i1.p1 TRINITY_DN5730_c0_g1~~TRINITY_DN5730_c0_g1_i1.p1  ORF type:complete len:431 (-),score=129.68 TRINITY_DN5730_c0_g1_i1:276-1568(-)